MTTKSNDDYLELGELYREHGIDGGVKLFIYSMDSANLIEGKSYLFERASGETLEGVLASFRPHQKWYICHFDCFKNPEMIFPWRKAKVSIRRTELAPLEKNEAYLVDLLGYEIVTTEGQLAGNLNGMEGDGEMARFVVLRKVDGGRDPELMIPAHERLIKKIDHDKKQIVMELPEGLLEL